MKNLFKNTWGHRGDQPPKFIVKNPHVLKGLSGITKYSAELERNPELDAWRRKYYWRRVAIIAGILFLIAWILTLL